MKVLLQCLVAWLHEGRSETKAWRILNALAQETLKRADSADPAQREFDAHDIAQICEPDKQWNYDSAKKWLTGAEVLKYMQARKGPVEAFFRAHGHCQAITVAQRKTTGRHRAPWFLSIYDLLDIEQDEGYTEKALVSNDYPATGSGVVAHNLVYEFTPPSDIKLNLLGQLFLGVGIIHTRSPRALLWAGMWLGALGLTLLSMMFFLAMSQLSMPLRTGDLIAACLWVGYTWVFWRFCVRPMIWLLEDRIALGGSLLSAWREEPVQLDMTRDQKHRYLRLVRYSGVCPLCAGAIELRYGQGVNARRIFGCCGEAPQEHVFTFDRVTRVGRRYEA